MTHSRRLEYGKQVTSSDGSPEPDALDPAFEGLFRPSDIAAEAPVYAEVAVAPEATGAASAGAPDAAPEPRRPVSDTGRLFRSQGVDGHDDTVLALESGRFSRLRTLERTTDAPFRSDALLHTDAAGEASAVVVESGDPQVATLLGAGAARQDDVASQEAAPMPEQSRRGRRPDASGPRGGRRSRALSGPSGQGIPGGAVALVVIGVTVLIGVANAVLGGGALGWPTGVALLASSVYASLVVRRESDAIAFLMPPVAFLVAALTAGQLFLDANEGSIINRAAIVFFTLAENWIWILGSTLAALVIVLVRRRR